MDLADPDDFLAMGRVFDSVADQLFDGSPWSGTDLRSSTCQTTGARA